VAFALLGDVPARFGVTSLYLFLIDYTSVPSQMQDKGCDIDPIAIGSMACMAYL